MKFSMDRVHSFDLTLKRNPGLKKVKGHCSIDNSLIFKRLFLRPLEFLGAVKVTGEPMGIPTVGADPTRDSENK